ncbi:ead/Ea22-like family protein [Klebsiella michiganensis]|uniref:ead/Ea22-like family protein n=1 Tax=Klebsiella michiganensis TaxID=1134687 RepID=UPI001D193D8B|nr:ead/Ea22-like family protein [Klebsiella michiganensis]
MNIKTRDLKAMVEALEKAQQHIVRQEQILLNQDESLSIRRGELEAAQQERDNWHTSFDNERFRADKLKAHIDDIEPIRASAEKLVRCKGRYHSEQNYRALAALFGVTTPDLPPLEHENVHYADAADMEIAALRQRIAELESRTVTVKLPTTMYTEFEGDDFCREVAVLDKQLVIDRLTAAGIKWEAE